MGDWLIALAVFLFLTSAAMVSRAADQMLGAAAPATQPASLLECVGEVPGSCGLAGEPFSADGRLFLSSAQKAVRVWDARTARPVTGWLRQTGLDFRCFRLSGDGKTVLTASKDEVTLWDVATSRVRSVTKSKSAMVLREADVSPDGSRLAASGYNDMLTVAVWRAGEANPAFCLNHGSPVQTVDFDPTGAVIVTSENHWVERYHLWAADTGRELCLPISSNIRDTHSCRLQFDASGRRLLIPDDYGFIVADARTGKPLLTISLTDAGRTEQVRFSADGTKLAVTSDGFFGPGRVHIYDASTGKVLQEFDFSHAVDCQIDPTGRWALLNRYRYAPKDLTELWDLKAEKKVSTFSGGVRLSRDGSTLLVRTTYGTTTVWRWTEAARKKPATKGK
jgi:WD40 repeat protein